MMMRVDGGGSGGDDPQRPVLAARAANVDDGRSTKVRVTIWNPTMVQCRNEYPRLS